MATDARDLVRRVAGDVAGLTVAAQIRQAARHLGYPPESWRVREAWYRRAGAWSAAALDDLRQRGAAWRERAQAQAQAGTDTAESLPALAHRVEAIRLGLADVTRQFNELAAEIAMTAEIRR